jgi:hypothetical protein
MHEKYVPDLDAYTDAWVELAKATTEEAILKLQLEEAQAKIFVECMTKPEYKLNGRPPAISFIENSWAKVGHTKEMEATISDLRRQLISVNERIDSAKATLKIEEMKLNLYQTMSANSRNVASLQ